MPWYDVISHNSSCLKMYVAEITKYLCQLHCNELALHLSFKSVIYRQLLFYLMVLKKCLQQKFFIYKETHGKYSRLQVSDNFQIIKLKGVRTSRTNRKTRLKQNKISNKGLNELMRMIDYSVCDFFVLPIF